MSTFQSSFESNTTKANATISNMSVSLRTEKETLKKVHIGIQFHQFELNSSITSKITKLQDDLAFESKITDALTCKTEKVKLLTVKLESAEKKVNEFLSERAVAKAMFPTVFLTFETRGESKKPSPKKVSEQEKPKVSKSKPKGNVYSGSKGKEKVLEEEEKEEEEDKNEKPKCKAHDTILDENMRIEREAEEKEMANRDAQTALAAKKLLFPPRSMERMLKKL
ncbi:unnamed protein product [Lactuca saligna]|uniref:Uncharacterized protein n=1 Tax=Lactuca saligna TaxID=75948 RepID=A0AA36E2L2_LACSI|nr:unnamed protein product [Lactuca saligna]